MQKWHILGKLFLNSCSCCFTCWQGFWLQSSLKNDKEVSPGDPVVLVQAHFPMFVGRPISCSYRTEKIYFWLSTKDCSQLYQKTNKQKLQLNRVRGQGRSFHICDSSGAEREEEDFSSFLAKTSQWKVMDSSLICPPKCFFFNESILLLLTMWGILNVSSPWLQKIEFQFSAHSE